MNRFALSLNGMDFLIQKGGTAGLLISTRVFEREIIPLGSAPASVRPFARRFISLVDNRWAAVTHFFRARKARPVQLTRN